MENKELANIIYDTLMGNRDEIHPNIDLNKVEGQEIDGNVVSFVYDGLACTFEVRTR